MIESHRRRVDRLVAKLEYANTELIGGVSDPFIRGVRQTTKDLVEDELLHYRDTAIIKLSDPAFILTDSEREELTLDMQINVAG